MPFHPHLMHDPTPQVDHVSSRNLYLLCPGLAFDPGLGHFLPCLARSSPLSHAQSNLSALPPPLKGLSAQQAKVRWPCGAALCLTIFDVAETQLSCSSP
jgi:hypothetical protein